MVETLLNSHHLWKLHESSSIILPPTLPAGAPISSHQLENSISQTRIHWSGRKWTQQPSDLPHECLRQMGSKCPAILVANLQSFVYTSLQAALKPNPFGELTKLKQGGRPLEEYIDDFQMMLARMNEVRY
nr:uncharacterized protein LOC109155092 [Ipomoea batatas]GMD99614.1 uncharacterized protein LOC109155092 [Ipomoea batatas]